MKWFKHDADAFLSEGVDALIDAEGFAGYGRWNRILEIVSFKMDETDRCHAEYSIQKWCRLLGLKQKKLISFLELTEKQLKTKVVHSENIIRIEIPNLLKKRDNYTKHLQVPKQPLVSIDRDIEVDRDIDKDKTVQYEISFGEFWETYPKRNGKKIGKAVTKKKFLKIKTGDLANIIVAVHNYADSQAVRDGYGRDPERFFKNDYWKEWMEGEELTDDFTPTSGGGYDTSRRPI